MVAPSCREARGGGRPSAGEQREALVGGPRTTHRGHLERLEVGGHQELRVMPVRRTRCTWRDRWTCRRRPGTDNRASSMPFARRPSPARAPVRRGSSRPWKLDVVGAGGDLPRRSGVSRCRYPDVAVGRELDDARPAVGREGRAERVEDTLAGARSQPGGCCGTAPRRGGRASPCPSGDQGRADRRRHAVGVDDPAGEPDGGPVALPDLAQAHREAQLTGRRSPTGRGRGRPTGCTRRRLRRRTRGRTSRRGADAGPRSAAVR